MFDIDLSSLRERLETEFGRGYFLCGVLPFSMAGLLSVFCATSVSIWASDQVARILSFIVKNPTLGLGVALLCGLLGGFVWWSLLGVAHRTIALENLPFRMRDAFIRYQQRELRRSLEGVQAAEDKVAALLVQIGDEENRANSPWLTQLLSARKQGALIKPTDTTRALRSADKVLNRLDSRLQAGALSLESLQSALASVCSMLTAGPAGKDGDESAQLRDKLHVRFVRLCEALLDQCEAQVTARLNLVTSRFPAEEKYVGPSRLANIAAIPRARLLIAYGFDADAFESHLGLVVRNDDGAMQAMSSARVRADFSVSLLVLCVTALGWTVALGILGASPRLFLALALGTPPIMLSVLGAHSNNTRLASETLLTVAELKRFEILKALHLPLPTTWKAEKDLWAAIATRYLGSSGAAPDGAYASNSDAADSASG